MLKAATTQEYCADSGTRHRVRVSESRRAPHLQLVEHSGSGRVCRRSAGGAVRGPVRSLPAAKRRMGLAGHVVRARVSGEA